jgi:type II secretory pathway component GspD/PulD (secretin)
MIERLMPASNVATTTRSSGDGLLGSVAGGISNIGRGIMNMSGLNQTLSGSQTLRVVTDIRSNALFVTGPNDQVAEVEQLLEVLDSSELPESLRDRVPRTIPVEYADVDEVAEVVETVFKDAMTPENPLMGGGQRGGTGGGGFNPLMMLMAGGQAQGGRRQGSVQLTVGVDRRTSHLIVSCNDSLFQQIQSLVEGIDERARRSRQTVRVVKLDQADPTLVQQTLGAVMPKVTVGATRRSRQPAAGGAASPGGPPGAPTTTPAFPPGGDAVRDAFLQRMLERSRGGGDGGSRGGDGRSDGNRGGGSGDGGGRRFRSFRQ